MKKEINNILLQMQNNNIDVDETTNQLLNLFISVNTPLFFTKNEVDFAYCAGVFNTGGIDKLSDELNRLKELKKEPSDIILVARNGR
jgi:hypothetical protein